MLADDRGRPLAIFRLPAGFMLVPDVDDTHVDEAVASLLATKLPPSLASSDARL